MSATIGLLEPLNAETGAAPPSRIESAEGLRRYYLQLVKEDRQRSIQRALMRANLNMKPPYDVRNRKGFEWTANINFGGAKARIDQSCQPYHALFSGVDRYYNCRTAYRNLEDVERANDIISVGFHKMIKTWKGYEWHEQHRIREMLTEGWGPVVWDREDNWRYRAIDANSIYVERNSPSALDDRHPAITIRIPYTAAQLYNLLRDEPASKKRGWNTEAVKWAIRFATQQISAGQNWQTAPWEMWEKVFQHNDLCASQNNTIWTVHCFVQEFAKPGQKNVISHYITTEGDVPGGSPEQLKFLFEHRNRYEEYDEALVVFFQNIGDGEWHSVRGLAMQMFRHDVLINRLMCAVANAAFMDSTVMLIPQTQADSDKLAQIKMSPGVSVLPAATQVQQTRLAGSMAGVLEATRMFTNDLAQNTSLFNSRTIAPELGGSEKPTAFHVNAILQQDQSMKNDSMTLDYLTRDRVGWQMFKRAANPTTTDVEAKKFQRYCAENGVPIEALQDMECVTANRLAGYGSQQMRQLTADKMMSIAPMVSEDGKQNITDDFIVAYTLNPHMRDRYNPREAVPTPDDELIWQENAGIRAGMPEPPPIISGQNSVKHLQGHILDMEKLAGPLQEAMEMDMPQDPAELERVFRYLQVMGPHLEEHLSKIEGDQSRQPLVKYFTEKIKAVTFFHGELRQAIRKAQSDASLAQQEEQQAAALGIKDQAELASTEADIERKNMKTGADIQRKNLEAAARVQRDTALAAHTARLKSIETASNVKNKKAPNGAKPK